MFKDVLSLINKVQWKAKDFAEIISNLSFYFESLGIPVFKKQLSVTVSVTKYFHCNLPFLF